MQSPKANLMAAGKALGIPGDLSRSIDIPWGHHELGQNLSRSRKADHGSIEPLILL